MSVSLLMCFTLLMHSCFCSVGNTNSGCMQWKQRGNDVCCDACHPGHRLVKECGPDPTTLCILCEPETYTTASKDYRCQRCTQCIGPHILVKECTASADTQCDCKEGLICGDERCAFCVDKCGKGQEPTGNRSCRACPDGTFNDQTHQKCKPWSTKCPHPDQVIVAKGDAFNDIKCDNIVIMPLVPDKPNHEEPWPLGLFVVLSVVLLVFSIIIFSSSMLVKVVKRRTMKKTNKKTPIIRTPTDEPRTLIAIECSFHEAEQEQGSSSESLASKDSSGQLIA